MRRRDLVASSLVFGIGLRGFRERIAGSVEVLFENRCPQVQVLFRNLVIQVSFDTSERDVTTAEEAATLDVARTVVKEL